MEEAELLKARLLAITNKRKIQEEITRQRFQVEGEKMKLKHLKSKGLRERWLVEGITAIPLQEQEAMKKQHQEDQQQSKQLEQNILRLEEDIENLETQEVQISANEQLLLAKLKTTEDVIKATKAETDQGPVQFIYSKIPDLPKSYEPCNLQSTASQEQEPLKTALFAVEINVQKDMKTGESTVLSTVPVTADQIRDRGVKVYEDGIKSVYAVCTDGRPMHNGVSNLTHEEVEALLEQVEEKKESVSASCHAPVFSSPYHKCPSPKIILSERGGRESEIRENMTTNETVERHEPVVAQIYRNSDIITQQNRMNFSESPQPTLTPSPLARSPVPGSTSPSSRWSHSERGSESPVTRNQLNPSQLQQRENHREAVFISSDLDNDPESSSADEETDIKFSIVHSLPSGVNTEDPVTMIFMGYHDIDDEDEAQKVLSFDGAIRAELIVLSDDDNSNEDDASEMPPREANGNMYPGFPPTTVSSTGERCNTSNAIIDLITGDSSTPKNSLLVSGPDTSTHHSAHKTYSDGQRGGSSEDPSVSGNDQKTLTGQTGFPQNKNYLQSVVQPSASSNEEKLKQKIANVGGIYCDIVTMETNQEGSESESSDEAETITMETKVTGNGTVYPEKVNVVTEEEYFGLKDTGQIMNIHSRTAEPRTAENVKESKVCSEDKGCINQELREAEQDLASTPVEFETIPAYKMSGDSFDILENKQSVDFLTAALNELSDNNLAREELAQTASDTESQSTSATENTTLDSEGEQEEYRFSESPTAVIEEDRDKMITFQTITEVHSETSANGEDAEKASIIEVEKTTSQDTQHLVKLFTMDTNGPIQHYLASSVKETSNESTIPENATEPIVSVVPNEPSPISTPIENVTDKLETVHKEFRSAEKYLPKINKHVEFKLENGSVQILDDTEQSSYEFEITDLQDKKATDNVDDRYEAASKHTASKNQWDLQIPGENSNFEKLSNENVDTEHVDFAAARRQWLMIEETSKSQSCQLPFKRVKNQLKTKCINVKEKRCDSSIGNSMQKEGTYPHSASVNFPKDKGKNNHLVGNNIFDTDANYWRSSLHLAKEEDILASQENTDLVRDSDQNLTLKPDAFRVGAEENRSYLDGSAHKSLLSEPLSFVPLVHGRKAETPIEKEIRRNVKREESLRRARGMKKNTCSGEYVEIKSSLSILQPNFSSSTKLKNNQLAEMQMQREILLERKREEDLVRQGKIRETYNEGLSPEIGARKKIFEQQYVSTSRNSLPPSPHNNNSSSSFLPPSPLKNSPSYNEMKVSNVINLEEDAMVPPVAEKARCAAPPKGRNSNEWPPETANVITSGSPNLIVRSSSSDFSLSSAPATDAELTVQNNPFFKLRSRSSVLDLEIKKVQEREEELRRQRDSLCAMPTSAESSLSSLTSSENFRSGYCEKMNVPPPSPMSAMMELDRLHNRSVDLLAQRLETAESIVKKNDSMNIETRKTHRKNAMALRWEAGIFADNQDNEL